MKFRLNEYGSKNIEKIENLDATNLYDLGKKLLNGDGVERDFRKGKEYLEKSADLGNKKAFDMLGIMYLNGFGVEKDLDIALDYFKKADQPEKVELINTMKDIWGDQYKYVKNKKESLDSTIDTNEFRENSKSKNSDEKQNNDKNINSEELFQKGYNLLGNGNPKDLVEAREYLEKASEYGNKKASFVLGSMYLNALGVEQNLKKSLEYYKKSDSKTQIELTDKLIREYGENYKYINEINHKNDMYIHLPIEFKNDEKEKNEKLYFQKNLQSDSEINKQDIINKYIAKIDERLDELGSSRRVR